MTTQQIETFVSLASTELLSEIVASNSPKWKWHRFYAKRELVAR